MPSGRARGILVGVAFLIIVGALLGIDQLFVMAAGLLILLIVGYLLALRGARLIEVQQGAPDLVMTGHPFEARLTVRSGIRVSEPVYDILLSLPDEVEWQDMREERLQDGVSVTILQLVARKRGVHQLSLGTILAQDPMGLFRVRVSTGQDVEIAAWPEPVNPSVSGLEASGEGTAGQMETGQRSMTGSAIHGVRQWYPGDPLSRVHWPSTAKLGHLAVMEFEVEASDDMMVILDEGASASGDSGEGFETACGVVAYLLERAWENRKRLTAVIQGQRIESQFGHMNEMQRREALGALARTRLRSSEEADDIIRRSAATVSSGTVAVVVTSRWDERLQAALGHLARPDAMPVVLLAGKRPDTAPQHGEPRAQGIVVYTVSPHERTDQS